MIDNIPVIHASILFRHNQLAKKILVKAGNLIAKSEKEVAVTSFQ